MKRIILNLIAALFVCNASFAQRQVEELNRGLIAVFKGGKNVYVSWRLLAKDDWTMGFNVYRSTAGAAATLLNTAPITNSTNFTDTKADITKENVYYVKSVVDGVELETSEKFTLAANTPNRQFFPISLKATSTTYDVLHVYAGDVDGDGDFDYIVKRFPQDAKYNYILLECYLNDGTFKWRIDLGPNVETYISSMTAPVLVADFDGDGKAEIIAKTGEGTSFADGTKIGDTNNDGTTDYNSHAGSGTYANVMTGPEFISYIDGETGKEIDRNNFIARGKSTDWGDDYGARMNFIMSGVCSFDGVKPGVIFSRGPGNVMGIEAWEVTNNKLVRRWQWSARGKTFANGGSWHDFHQITSIDVDGDGKDETSWGVTMMNPDGTVRYATNKYTHGDRLQITDINPNRPGLEAFVIQQYNGNLIGSALYDASTGATIKDWYIAAKGDIGRGDVADVDPNSPGMEMFDVGQPGLHSCTGTEINATERPYPNVSIWWDGDLLREFFVGIGGNGFNPAINKWNYTNKTEDRLFTIYNDWGNYSVISPYAGRAAFIGDIMGDWREEIALETADHTTLRIYTTNIETSYRIYTLMQNPAYRNATTSKGYLCTKYTNYFLGAGMATPPKPNITVIGATNDAPTVAISLPATGTSFDGPASIALNAVASDRDGKIAKLEFFSGITLIGTATASGVKYTYSWTNVAAGTYTITAKATDDKGAVTTSAAISITVNKPKPITYIYQAGTLTDWITTVNWTPATLPTDNDTAVIRTGEAKLAQDYLGYVKIEPNGILRATAYTNLSTVEVLGGAIKVNSSNQTYGMNANLIVKANSSVISGFNPITSFTLDGSISGSANLIKRDLGVVKLNATATNFKGMWIVENDTLTIASASGLGLCGAIIDTAVLDIDVAAATNSLTIHKMGKLNLDANLTVQAAVFDTINLAAGTYSSTDYPAYISGTGKLIVGKTLVATTSVSNLVTLTASAGTNYSWSNGTTEVATTAAFTPSVSGSYAVKVTTDEGCAISSAAIQVTAPSKQNISLTKGWNLISINIHPTDSSIVTLFKGLDVQEIKTMDAFWRKGQLDAFNGLQKLTTGEGYLVNMNIAGTLTVAGTPNLQGFKNLEGIGTGWHLIGCPYQSATPFSTIFNSTNCSVIKNFEGFWIPNDAKSSILNFEPGKGYFFEK